ncbi:MAG: DJ-1/PfpI family protein [Myxococcales bacterium]|nr:DJ-1/PfpI family protein [Myxococcales bacterium]
MRVWVPLPDTDFDVTEVAVPWAVLRDAGHDVVFATERGETPRCDPLLLTGVVLGQLGAEPEPCRLYHELERDPAFLRPRPWNEVDPGEMDALLLAGGHAQGMRQYLGSEVVQAQVARFFATGRPVAAICHGVLVAARAKGPDGRSPLHGRRTTCLPKYMEQAAFYATAWLRGHYYRTYPAYVQDEVSEALAAPSDFVRGPFELFRRGQRDDHGPAFVVEDGTYVSGRWPGDAWLLGERLVERL